MELTVSNVISTLLNIVLITRYFYLKLLNHKNFSVDDTLQQNIKKEFWTIEKDEIKHNIVSKINLTIDLDNNKSSIIMFTNHKEKIEYTDTSEFMAKNAFFELKKYHNNYELQAKSKVEPHTKLEYVISEGKVGTTYLNTITYYEIVEHLYDSFVINNDNIYETENDTINTYNENIIKKLKR